ncbi:DNA cytosine methyltransferase [Pseudomonas sp. Q2-TVG4-2]|uniref:DNA cytosine methyltransferase n=1 Tax=Pseudomonas sp. Q2-TVG4-2 TaxID=1685699 RepID=UPI0015E7215D|nr:DNA cytosine methyltransferase [Pseudomonas sp. Q2-TVG4-2]
MTTQIKLFSTERFVIKPVAVAGPRWVKAKKWPAVKRGSAPLRVVDLFSGFGGLTLGAWEGARLSGRKLEILLSADIASRPLAVYRKNFKVSPKVAIETPVECLFDGRIGDQITEIEQRTMSHAIATDLILAGPPCQGHSDLNNSTRRKDPRNALYLRAIRAIEVLEPAAAIIENVPTVIRDEGEVVNIATDRLMKLGYHVCSAVVNLSRLGVPQKRRRHVLVATRKKAFDFDRCLADNETVDFSVGDYLSGIEDESSNGSTAFYKSSQMTAENVARVNYLFDHDIYDLPNELRPRCHKDKKHSYMSMYGRMKWGEPAQTITGGFGSMGQGRFVHPTRRRLITAHEAARLQGIPDFFDFSSVSKVTALREMIGNAVPPQLSAAITKALIEQNFFD